MDREIVGFLCFFAARNHGPRSFRLAAVAAAVGHGFLSALTQQEAL